MKAQHVIVSKAGPPHGCKATYDRHKCRCDNCRAANAAYMKQYRRRKSPGEVVNLIE